MKYGQVSKLRLDRERPEVTAGHPPGKMLGVKKEGTASRVFSRFGGLLQKMLLGLPGQPLIYDILLAQKSV